MKSYLFNIIMITLLIVGLVVVGVVVKSLVGVAEIAREAALPAPVEQIQSAATQINGNFSGQVKLSGVATGVYSDSLTLAAGQPALGSVDLALQLSQTGNGLSGYVSLEKTLIFSVEHTIAGQTPIKIGPYVNGAFDGTTLTLQSERVTLVMGGQVLSRQFQLIGTLDADGTTLTGEYRETLWGYARQPITTIGVFTLKRPNYSGAVAPPSANPTPVPPLPTPSSPNPAPGGQSLYLPIVRR